MVRVFEGRRTSFVELDLCLVSLINCLIALPYRLQEARIVSIDSLCLARSVLKNGVDNKRVNRSFTVVLKSQYVAQLLL